MKKVLIYLAFMIAMPCVVYAGANALIFNKDVYVLSSVERESVVSQRFYNYRLVWNDDIRKFELHQGASRRPITAEGSLPLQKQPAPQFYTKELAI